MVQGPNIHPNTVNCQTTYYQSHPSLENVKWLIWRVVVAAAENQPIFLLHWETFQEKKMAFHMEREVANVVVTHTYINPDFNLQNGAAFIQ